MLVTGKPGILVALCAVSSLFQAPLHGGQVVFPHWLEGHWCMDGGREQLEELWLPAVDGESLGLNRTVAGGYTVGFEFLRIASIDGQLNYIAQPGGKAPVAFSMVAQDKGYIRFENRQHDFPQAIEYRHSGSGFQAAIEGPGENGETMRISFSYGACPQ